MHVLILNLVVYNHFRSQAMVTLHQMVLFPLCQSSNWLKIIIMGNNYNLQELTYKYSHLPATVEKLTEFSNKICCRLLLVSLDPRTMQSTCNKIISLQRPLNRLLSIVLTNDLVTNGFPIYGVATYATAATVSSATAFFPATSSSSPTTSSQSQILPLNPYGKSPY